MSWTIQAWMFRECTVYVHVMGSLSKRGTYIFFKKVPIGLSLWILIELHSLKIKGVICKIILCVSSHLYPLIECDTAYYVKQAPEK